MPFALNEPSVDSFLDELRQTAAKVDPSLKVNLRPSTYFSGGKKKYNPGQFTVEIYKGTQPDKNNTFYATISKSDNDTILLKQGVGYQLIEGEMKNLITEEGIEGTPQIISGTESFMRRVSGAFYLSEEEQSNPWKKSVKSYFSDINIGLEGTKTGKYINKILGKIAPSQNYLEPEVTEQRMHQLTRSYSVNVESKNIFKSAEKVLNQLIGRTSIDNIDQVTSTSKAMLDNSVLDVMSGKIQTQGAWGTLFSQTGGTADMGLDTPYTGVDLITEKPYKQRYYHGARSIGKPVAVTRSGIQDINSPYVGEAAVSFRKEGLPETGIRVKGAFPLHELPVQGGMVQFQLPKELKKQLNDMGGVLGVSEQAHRSIPIGNLTSLSGLAERLQVDRDLIGKNVFPGQSKRVGTYTSPSGEVTPYNISNKQNLNKITGYSLRVPAWMEEKYSSYTEDIVKLNELGIDVVPDTNIDEVVLDILQERVSSGAVKNIIKGGTNIPFVEGVKQEITGVEGLGNIEYDLMTSDVKGGVGITYSILKGMPTKGKNNLYDLMNFLYPNSGKQGMLASYEAQKQFGGANVEELAKIMGFRSPESFLDDITGRMFQEETVNGQKGFVPYERMNKDFNAELYRKFGIGRVRGQHPVQEFTPQTLKTYKEEAVLALMNNKDQKFTREQATTQVDLMLKDRLRYFKEGKKTRIVQYADSELITGPMLAEFVPELSGTGTTQGEYLQAMKAQDKSDIVNFLTENRSKIFRPSPGRKAMQEIAAGYLATRGSQTPDLAKSIIIGKGNQPGMVDAGTLLTQIRGLDPELSAVDKMKKVNEIINTMAGVDDKSARRLLYFPQHRATSAGIEAWLEADSFRNEIDDTGETSVRSQAQLAPRFLRILEALTYGEAEGEQDTRTVEALVNLSGKFTNSEQMRKVTAGIFSRSTGASLLQGEQVLISDEAMARAFEIAGGDRSNKNQWREYKKSFRSTTYGIGNRPPTTTVGTEDRPGSIGLVEIISSQQKEGKAFIDRWKKAGLLMPEMIQSQSNIGTMGDFDRDPYMMMPLSYFDDAGHLQKFKPKFEGTDKDINRQFKEWNEKVFGSFSPERQRKTFEDIFGDMANKYNPYDENLRAYFNKAGWKNVSDSWLNKRISQDINKLNKGILNFGEQRTLAAGTTFNTFIRSVEASSAMLGVPEKEIVRARDKGGVHYQVAVDTEHKQTMFENAIGTAGFWKNSYGKLELSFMNKDEGVAIWTAGQSEKDLTVSFANMLSGNQNLLDAEYFADLFTSIPEKVAGESESAYADRILKARNQVQKRVEGVKNFFGEDTVGSVKRLDEIQKMASEGLIGVQSPGVQALLTRASSYPKNDPAKLAEIQELSQKQRFKLYGKELNFDELKQEQLHTRMLFEYSKGAKGDSREWLNISNMASLFAKVGEKGIGEQKLIRELYQNYGVPAGFSDPWQPNFSLGGQPVPRTSKELEKWQAEYKEMLNKKGQEYLNPNKVMSLRSSTFGNIAKFSPGDMITAGALFPEASMYGWRNPSLALQGVTPFENLQQWNEIFGTRETAVAMKMGTEMERIWASELKGANLGKLGKAIEYGDTRPHVRYKGREGSYDLETKPDLLGFEKTGEGKYSITVTDLKNVNSNPKFDTIKEVDKINEKVQGYKPQLTSYAATIARIVGGEKVSPDLEKALLDTFGDNPVLKEILDPNIEKKEIKLKAQTYATQEKYTTDPDTGKEVGKPANEAQVRKNMQKDIALLSKGLSPEYGHLTTMYEETAIGPDNIKKMADDLQAEVTTTAEEAAKNIQKYTLPAAHAAMGQLKHYARAKYPELQDEGGINLDLTTEENRAMKALKPLFSTKSGREKEIEKMNEIPKDAFKRMYWEQKQNISSLEAILRPPEPATGGSGRGGGISRPNVALANPDDENVNGPKARKEVQQSIGYESDPEMKKLIAAVLAQSKGGGGSGGRGGGGGWGGINLAAANFDAMKMYAPQWGTVTEGGTWTPGRAMEVYSALPASLSGFFETRFPQVAQEIASAKPQEALLLAQRYAAQYNIPFKQIVSSIPDLQYFAGTAKRASYQAASVLSNYNQLAGSRNINTLPQAMLTPFTSRPQEEGSYGAEIQRAVQTLSMVPDLERETRTTGKKKELAATDEERIIAAKGVEHLEKYIETIEKTSKAVIQSVGSHENLNTVLQQLSKQTDDFRSKGAAGLSEMFQKLNGQFKEASVNVERFVRGKPTGEPLTSDEHLSILRGTKEGTVSPKEGLAYAKAYAAQEAWVQESAELLGKDKKDPNLRIGSIARKMLGGFGLMYMGSILNIAATPMKYGYEEGIERELTFDKIMGASMGGVTPSRNIPAELQYAKSMYGGVGWRSFQSLSAQVTKQAPAVTEAWNTVQAGLGGAAMVGWVGGMAGVTGAAIAPWMIGAGVGIAATSLISNAVGASRQVDQNALSVFSHSLRTSNKIDPRTGTIRYGEQPGQYNALANGLNLTSLAGYLGNQEQQQLGQKLAVLEEYYKDGDNKDGAAYLMQKYKMGRDEANKIVSLYAQAVGGASELGFTPEIAAQASTLLNRYNMPINVENLDRAGTLYSQGIDVEQAGSYYTYSPYFSTGQNIERVGQYATSVISGGKLAPTGSEIEKAKTGAERYASMGFVAPRFQSTQEQEAYIKRIGMGGQHQWSAYSMEVEIARLKQAMGQEFELPDVDKYLDKEAEDILEKTREFKKISGGTEEKFDKYGQIYYKTSPAKYGFVETGETTVVGQTKPTSGMTPEESQQRQRELQPQLYTTQLQSQVFSNYQILGQQPGYDYMSMTNSELRNIEGMGQFAINIKDRLSGYGYDEGIADFLTDGSIKKGMLTPAREMISGNRFETAKRILEAEKLQPGIGTQMIDTGFGSQIPASYMAFTDIDLNGNITGMNWGTSSLQLGSISGQQMAQNIWGSQANWKANYGAGSQVINAMVNGYYNEANGQTYGGKTGAAMEMADMQYAMSTAQIGIQFKQIAMNKAFTTGVGLDAYAATEDPRTNQPFGFNTSGGGFWGIEDRSRALQYQQQEYGFQMQERQMDMGNKFFWQNFGINQQQSYMQRDWSRQDWGTQDQTRGLQWNWHQEDYQENVRFLTGRDRRLAERQMMRDTTMHNIEGEQIDRQRERQEELWDLEDRRFDLQKSQHEESLQLQREQLEKNKEFYLENKKLQEEQLLLSRAYWVEQIKLSEASAGASAAAAKQSMELSKTMAILNAEEEKLQGQYMLALQGPMAGFLKWLEETLGLLGQYNGVVDSDEPGVPGLPPIEGAPAIPTAAGKPVIAGGRYKVNDVLGGELFIPDRAGAVVPLSNSSVWGSTISQNANPSPQLISMVVYLGNDLLMSKVVEVVNSEVKID